MRRARGARFEHEGVTYAVLELPAPDLERPTPDGPALTAAERAVVELLLRGYSNEQIAQARGRSARTIANQLAGLYRRYDVGSRVELVAKLTRGRPA